MYDFLRNSYLENGVWRLQCGRCEGAVIVNSTNGQCTIDYGLEMGLGPPKHERTSGFKLFFLVAGGGIEPPTLGL